MGYFKDKVFTVTGGASGMARETVLILAKKGAIVYTSDINGEGLKQTVTLGLHLQ
jgi:NAD(P)-dependent dehydrogenase (short-subunit alcohol dehydrogenase family)